MIELIKLRALHSLIVVILFIFITVGGVNAIVNTPPISNANGPYTGTEGVEVTFDGSGSRDPGGTLESYTWDFGDASNGTGVGPNHTYAAAGVYTVILTVTDDMGAMNTSSTTATIQEVIVNQPPVANANGPYSGDVGVGVSFDGSGSSDPDGSIDSYTWDFGDSQAGSGINPNHTYIQNGSYTVTLTVTDNNGAKAQDTAQVTVDTGLMAEATGPYSATVGVSISFNGSASGGTAPYSYSWDFDNNDGINTDANGATPTHTFNNLGTYTVTLNVSDSDGKFATDALIITVKNVTTTKGSGGGSSGGIGTSGETFKNIVCTETDRRFIGKDQEVSFNFNLDCNYVTYVNFTGLISFGKEATKVEILNDTSSLVDKDAPDIVFKNLNVWIGSMGLISETNVEDPTISFYIDKSWVKDNSITLNTITLYSYDDYTKNWEKMFTRKVGEDSNSYYYKANLPIRINIGAFAISGINLSSPSMVSSDSSSKPPVIPSQTAQVKATQKINTVPSPITWTGIWKEKVPHYLIFFA
ncbi:MAG: PKD domain-containing protein, partial [ANME-2 cluster archaeon]|nr:PKD domain-containing protein [ANME-2 cluster archaeon]